MVDVSLSYTACRSEEFILTAKPILSRWLRTRSKPTELRIEQKCSFLATRLVRNFALDATFFLGTYEAELSLGGSFQEEFSIGEQLGHSWRVCRFTDGRLNDNYTKT